MSGHAGPSMDEGYEDASRNDGWDLDLVAVNEAIINTPAAVREMRQHGPSKCPGMPWDAGWLLRAVAVCEHTEQPEPRRTCSDATAPVSGLGGAAGGMACAAVRVRTPAVTGCRSHLGQSGVRIACMARTSNLDDEPVRHRLGYVEEAVGLGADEVEVKASRALCAACDWVELFEEVSALREAADRAQLVVLLPVETVGTLTNVYRTALVVMMAGANFVAPIDCCKLTPESPLDGPHPPSGGTPFECGLVLLRAARDYRALSGFSVGLKVLDCRSATDALLWLLLAKRVAGAEWAGPALLRVAGDGLLPDLRRALLSKDDDASGRR